jgi:hypothetical protein
MTILLVFNLTFIAHILHYSDGIPMLQLAMHRNTVLLKYILILIWPIAIMMPQFSLYTDSLFSYC